MQHFLVCLCAGLINGTPFLQVSIGTGEAASSADCHLEFSSYGDLSSLTWVANSPIPASLAGSLVSVDVTYGQESQLPIPKQHAFAVFLVRP